VISRGALRRRKMRVWVDQDLCIGDETCVELCPEVVEVDGEFKGLF